MENLSSIGENLSILDNDNLISLNGLENLTTLGNSLYIGTNNDSAKAGNLALKNLCAISQLITSGEVTSNEYKVMPQSLPYSTDENRTKVFNVNGKESIKVNTGWVDESYSEVIKQLMLSETIRLNDLPVNITSKSSPMKKGINDKIINYEIGFMYSYDTINNIQ